MIAIPNCFYRTSIKALILDSEKRFLLCLEKSGMWELPGGGLDFGERPHECIAREIKEEMGLEVKFISERPSYFVSGPTTGEAWKTMAVYETEVKNFDFKQSDECMEIRFFSTKEAQNVKVHKITEEFLREFDPGNH